MTPLSASLPRKHMPALLGEQVMEGCPFLEMQPAPRVHGVTLTILIRSIFHAIIIIRGAGVEYRRERDES